MIDPAGSWEGMPLLVSRAGGGARFAWDELFAAELATLTRGGHTGTPSRQFLGWCKAPRAGTLGRSRPAG